MIVKVGDATSVSHVYFGDTGADNTGQVTYDHTSEYMNFVTNTVERVRIDGSGNVGIGTTSPTALLEVAGDLLVGGPTASNKAVYSSSGNHLRLLSGNTGGAALLFQSGTPASPSELMRIDGATGNIGVGTSVVTEKLMVAGNVVPSAITRTRAERLHSSGALFGPRTAPSKRLTCA